jgi:hypothetical protein
VVRALEAPVAAVPDTGAAGTVAAAAPTARSRHRHARRSRRTRLLSAVITGALALTLAGPMGYVTGQLVLRS